MSRIIVRNLPEKITQDKLRSIFSEKGVITDVQLKFTKSGKFRKFAFIGFQKAESATTALESLNNTFINSSQIQIETCAGLQDPNKPRPWSKHAQDSSAFKNKHKLDEPEIADDVQVKKKKEKLKKIKDPKVEELLMKHKDDDLFKEFIESHMPKDEALLKLTEPDVDELKKEIESKKKLADQDISDLQYFKKKISQNLNDSDNKIIGKRENVKEIKKKEPKKVKLFTIKMNGLPYNVKKSEIKTFLSPVKPFTIRRPVKLKGIAFCGFKTENDMKKALIKNRSFLSGKRILISVSESRENELDKKKERWKSQEERLKDQESVAESGRIFLRNLSYTVTEEDVTKLFEAYGLLSEIILPIDNFTRKPKGYGIVTFLMPEHACKAFNELDGTIFQGRMLHLLPGIANDAVKEDDNDGSFKKKKSQKQKTTSGLSTNWNTFFIGENTLAEAMAATYNTTKDKVLDDGQSGAAVRLALGETQIINQMKEFLEGNGVSLDAFNNLADCVRSKTIILVKNLPYGTKAEEIRDKFSDSGELKRIVLPPNGVAAIVEFIEPSEARKAFRRLAYSKFKHVPMYLEWAPEKTFTNAQKKDDKEETKSIEPKKDKPETESSLDSEKEVHEPVEGATIFVKNLKFSTDVSTFKQHFSKCGKIISATIAGKNDPKQPGKKLSLGYGFVEFATKEMADTALKTLQSSTLDDHAIELKRSNRTSAAPPKTIRKSADVNGKPNTKIVVRNIPFQATQKEVQELFKVFGEIKALRLPKKMVGSGSHRGFCFIEFHTIHDAKRAFKALSQSTHLYGRRLVLEWAAADDDVETLREKTALHFESGRGTKKKNITIEEQNKEM